MLTLSNYNQALHLRYVNDHIIPSFLILSLSMTHVFLMMLPWLPWTELEF